jgi:repressor LexA
MSEMRSSKRQKELLNFVDGFIQGNGYGPSYREIMRALGYKSVSTVAIHINGLIAKGYLHKRDHSARSLAVDTTHIDEAPTRKGPSPAQEKWLIGAVTQRFDCFEKNHDEETRDELYVLIGALKILGLSEAHLSMKARLTDLKRA